MKLPTPILDRYRSQIRIVIIRLRHVSAWHQLRKQVGSASQVRIKTIPWKKQPRSRLIPDIKRMRSFVA
jgi:hypothetical protein